MYQTPKNGQTIRRLLPWLTLINDAVKTQFYRTIYIHDSCHEINFTPNFGPFPN